MDLEKVMELSPPLFFVTVPAVISFSPTRMSFREKGVEAYLPFFQKCLFLFLVTRLRGW